MTISVMVNGLPGKMATDVARRIATNPKKYSLVPFSFCSQRRAASALAEGIIGEFIEISDRNVQLVAPDKREQIVSRLPRGTIAVDFTKPEAVNDNAEFYIENNLPFVMGTTGGDRAKLEAAVKHSKTCAVISPNMAKPIVMFLAMMDHAGYAFEGAFDGYTLEVVESHRKGKKDPSGTALHVVEHFRSLGVSFRNDQITSVRDPEIQKEIGVPEQYLDQHGWHSYTLRSGDGNVLLRFVHNVNGRSVYVDGTLDAINFLAEKIAMIIPLSDHLFTMLDVYDANDVDFDF